MSVPYNPAPLEELRRRYDAAVADVYDHADVGTFGANRPSEKPQHVFDFEDGLRLIISRERSSPLEGIHISASLQPGRPLYFALPEMLRPPQVLKRMALDRWAELTGALSPADVQEAIERGEAKFAGFSPGKGIPHWFVVLQVVL